MFNWLKNIVKGHGAAAVREALVGMVVHEIQEGGKIVVDMVMKKITDHHRAELLFFIRSMTDDYARETLLQRHQALGKNDNRFVDLLTRLYLVIKDDPSQHWIFTALGYMSPEEFDQTLYFLENDVIPQWFRKATAFLREVGENINESLNTSLQPIADGLRTYTQNNRARKGFRT